MFFFVGKKKWLEMEDQLQAAKEAAEDCRVRLNAMQKTLTALQGEISHQAAASAETVTCAMRLGFDEVRTGMLQQTRDSQEATAQTWQRLDTAAASYASFQESAQANDSRILAGLERQGQLLAAQEAAGQDAKAELLRYAKDSLDAVSGIRQKLEDAAESSAAFQESALVGKEQITAEITRIGREISEQLMLLDESCRLLLLHTVMDDLDTK